MRAQFWLFEHVVGYTGNRPAPLSTTKHAQPDYWQGLFNDDDDDDDDDNEGDKLPPLPCYKDCRLAFLPNPEPEEPDMLVLEITFNRTKNSLCLVDPNLAPITSFLTIAFADDAFAPPSVRTPADLYKLKVDPNLCECAMPWKDSVLRTPIFQDMTGEALTYGVLRAQQVRLGQASCFKEVMRCYGLRRGVDDAVSGRASPTIAWTLC